MTFLLDTHLLIWALVEPKRIPKAARNLIVDEGNELLFSAVSVLEVAIKSALRRPDFPLDPQRFRRELLANAYAELPISSLHAAEVGSLPALHKDPFDRLLVGQAIAEGVTLLTVDPVIARYPGPIRKV